MVCLDLFQTEMDGFSGPTAQSLESMTTKCLEVDVLKCRCMISTKIYQGYVIWANVGATGCTPTSEVLGCER